MEAIRFIKDKQLQVITGTERAMTTITTDSSSTSPVACTIKIF